jgi:hypothetical protein
MAPSGDDTTRRLRWCAPSTRSRAAISRASRHDALCEHAHARVSGVSLAGCRFHPVRRQRISPACVAFLHEGKTPLKLRPSAVQSVFKMMFFNSVWLSVDPAFPLFGVVVFN